MLLKHIRHQHSGFRFLIRLGIARATFIVRDPRDVILSAIDHGNRTEEGAADDWFKQFTDVGTSIPLVEKVFENYYQWKVFGRVLILKYEDRMESPELVLKQLTDFLQLDIEDAKIRSIADQQVAKKKASHNFNKGTCRRYLSEMDPTIREQCTRQLHTTITDLGYETESSIPAQNEHSTAKRACSALVHSRKTATEYSPK